MIYLKHGWLLDWEVYYNYTTGLNTSSAQFDPLIWDIELTKGSSKAVGLDLLLKKKWDQISFWLNYSLAHAKYTFQEKSAESFNAPQDIRHIGNVVGNYQFKRFQFSLTGRFHSGLPFTEPSEIVTIVDDHDNSRLYVLEYDTINTRRLRQYGRFDLGVHYRTPFEKKGKLRAEISLSVINVLNRNNVYAREYYLDLKGSTTEIPSIAFVNKTLLERTPLLLFRLYW